MPVANGSWFHGTCVVVINNVFCHSYLHVIIINIKELAVADRHRLANHTASVILPENLILLTALTHIHIKKRKRKKKKEQGIKLLSCYCNIISLQRCSGVAAMADIERSN